MSLMLLICALSVGEIFSIGGLTALIGMGVTFSLLMLLIFALVLMERLPKLKLYVPKKVQPENTTKVDADNQSDTDITAAIIAAITIVMSQEDNQQNVTKPPFVVKSIKRI